MTSQLLEKVAQEWQTLAPVLAVPRNKIDFQQRVALLNELIDIVGDDESHPLADLLETVGIIVSTYERSQFAMPDVSNTDVLQYLMQEHQLTSQDLPEIGNQTTVAAVLSGEQLLNFPQIQALCTRFCLSPAVFFPSSS